MRERFVSLLGCCGIHWYFWLILSNGSKEPSQLATCLAVSGSWAYRHVATACVPGRRRGEKTMKGVGLWLHEDGSIGVIERRTMAPREIRVSHQRLIIISLSIAVWLRSR